MKEKSNLYSILFALSGVFPIISLPILISLFIYASFIKKLDSNLCKKYFIASLTGFLFNILTIRIYEYIILSSFERIQMNIFLDLFIFGLFIIGMFLLVKIIFNNQEEQKKEETTIFIESELKKTYQNFASLLGVLSFSCYIVIMSCLFGVQSIPFCYRDGWLFMLLGVYLCIIPIPFTICLILFKNNVSKIKRLILETKIESQQEIYDNKNKKIRKCVFSSRVFDFWIVVSLILPIIFLLVYQFRSLVFFKQIKDLKNNHIIITNTYDGGGIFSKTYYNTYLIDKKGNVSSISQLTQKMFNVDLIKYNYETISDETNEIEEYTEYFNKILPSNQGTTTILYNKTKYRCFLIVYDNYYQEYALYEYNIKNKQLKLITNKLPSISSVDVFLVNER